MANNKAFLRMIKWKLLKVKLWKFGAHEKDREDAIFIKGHTKSSVCIVGAGFSGLCMGVKLKKAGIPFRILEKGRSYHSSDLRNVNHKKSSLKTAQKTVKTSCWRFERFDDFKLFN